MSSKSTNQSEPLEAESLGKRYPETVGDELSCIAQKKVKSQQPSRTVSQEYEQPFADITQQIIIRVELNKIMTGAVESFAILSRNQDIKREVYAMVLHQKDNQDQICFLESHNNEQHHVKIIAYRTSSYDLSNLMPIEESENLKSLVFVQIPRIEPENEPHKAELVLFLREKKIYKVFIKVLAKVDGIPTLFKMGNARNSLAICVQKTKLYLLFGLKTPNWHEQISSQVLCVPLPKDKLKLAVKEISLQESLYPIDQLDNDLLYCAMLFETGEIGILVASKSKKAQVGEFKTVQTLASKGKSRKLRKLKVVNMFFKPHYNTLIVISETPDHDYYFEVFSVTFTKDESCIKITPNEQNYRVTRSLLLDQEEDETSEDTNIHFVVTETFVNMSLEVLAIPENLRKFTAFKFKYDKETETHEEIRYGQLDNSGYFGRNGRMIPETSFMRAPRSFIRTNLDATIFDPDRTDNEDDIIDEEIDLAPFVVDPHPPLMNLEFGETRNPIRQSALSIRTTVEQPLVEVRNKPEPCISDLEGCTQFDPSFNLTANCNAFVDKSKQLMFIFKK